MKKITLEQDKKFRTDIELEVLCLGGIRENENTCNDMYVFNGTKNNLHIKFDNNNGSEVYTLFCRFDKTNEITGNLNPKCNFFLKKTNNIDEDVKEFKKHIRQLILKIN